LDRHAALEAGVVEREEGATAGLAVHAGEDTKLQTDPLPPTAIVGATSRKETLESGKDGDIVLLATSPRLEVRKTL
jgi:hypothetical protein